jgi:hypothetical protein
MKSIIELAREAGIDVDTAWGVAETAIERFAALVRNEALEEFVFKTVELGYVSEAYADEFAAAIRALAKEKT